MVSRLFYTYEEAEIFFNDRKKLGIKPGLKRIKQLLEWLDHPQKKVKAIHIAGTNGKGSTVHYLSNALKANGYKTGVFTSPSLHGLTGHFYLNSTQMSKVELITFLNTVYPYIVKMDEAGDAPTEYEILTAISWLFFSKHADIALVEAGMGGREDTTNCFLPIVSIITNVSLDHTKFIGSTLPEIAYHKAGIIKNQVPVILGEMTGEVRKVMDQEIQKNKSHAFFLGETYHYEKQIENKFIWKWNNREQTITLRMAGEHQIKNASITLMTLSILKQLNWNINKDQSIEAIERTTIPGRFEKIMDKPTILIDAAHNPAGIGAFISTIKEFYDPQNINVVFAAFKDKDIESMLGQLMHQFNNITLTEFAHPRSMRVSDLETCAYKYNINITKNWQEEAHKALQSTHAIHCFTGSFQFVSVVRDYLLKMNE